MVNANAGYSMADFEPIANMIFDPGILVVGMDSKFKTLQDLIDAAKKAPGQIKISHSGNGGDDWYNGLMIAKLAGVSFNLVPFDGDAPAWQAAAGGHVDVCTTNVGVVTGLVQGKKLRGLAVYTEKRLPSIPDVPTLKELGVDLVEGSYRGYLAPKGTPKEIIDILADGLEKVSADPQFKAACAAVNMVPNFRRGDAYKTFLATEGGDAPQDRQGDETHPVIRKTGRRGITPPPFRRTDRFVYEGTHRFPGDSGLRHGLHWRAPSSLKVGTLAQPGAGQFPAAIAVCLLAISGFHAWRTFRKTAEKEEGHSWTQLAPAGIAAALIVYPILLKTLNFLLSTFLVLFVLFRLLRFKTTTVSFLTALVTTLLSFIIFAGLLGVVLPTGSSNSSS